jgi:hypothetical protein
MEECEVCGNEYDKTITVTGDGQSHVFDSFVCAIHALAPQCAHCGCRVIGHGVEDAGAIDRCACCAAQDGVQGVCDRAETALMA